MNRKQYSLGELHLRLQKELRAIRSYEPWAGTDESVLQLLNRHKSVFIALHDYIASSPQWKSECGIENILELEAGSTEIDWRRALQLETERMTDYRGLTCDRQFDLTSRRFVLRRILPEYEGIVRTAREMTEEMTAGITAESRTPSLSGRACAG